LVNKLIRIVLEYHFKTLNRLGFHFVYLLKMFNTKTLFLFKLNIRQSYGFINIITYIQNLYVSDQGDNNLQGFFKTVEKSEPTVYFSNLISVLSHSIIINQSLVNIERVHHHSQIVIELLLNLRAWTYH